MKVSNMVIRKFTWTDYLSIDIPTDWIPDWKYTINMVAFHLSDKDCMTTEANRWDQYKWLKTKITWRPGWSGMDLTQLGTNSASSTISSLPYWAAKVDHDDVAVDPTVLDDIIKDGGRHGVFDRPKSVTFRPTALSMVYKGVSSTGYAVPRVTPWIDCVDQTVPHYGLKWGIGIKKDSATKASWLPYYLEVTHWVAFKNHLQALNQGGNF